MAGRKVKRFRIDLGSEQIVNMTCIMGVALFARIVYFFGLTRLEEAGFMHLTFGLILPLMLEAVLIVLIRGIRFHNPGLYILLCAALCLMLFFQCFRYDSILRMILGFVSYLACGAAFVALLGGFLNEKIVKWTLLAVAAGRLIFFNLFQNVFGLHLIILIYEIAAILDLVAMGMFAEELRTKK